MPTIKTKLNIHIIMAATIAAVAGILFGFDTGVISGAILFIKNQFNLSDSMRELVVSSVLVGALIGSFVSGKFTDVFGRRNLLVITSIIFILGTLGCAFAPNIDILIASRFVIGLAIGIASFTAPLYISEISPQQYRGMLVSLNQLAVTLGILIAYLVDMGFADTKDSWRWMFGFGIIPSAILFLGMLMLPRSPRWLVLKGLNAEAKKTLHKIRGIFYNNHEFEEIEESVKIKSHWTMLFRRWLLPAITIGLMLGFLQQFTGINTIIYYAPTILQMTGIKSNTAAIVNSVGIGVVNVLFTIIALPLIDRWGRRPLLITGMAIMLVSLCLMALSFAYAHGAHYLSWFALASMILFIAGFAISLGPIMWLMFSEIFPLEIRGIATSMMASANWLFNFIVAETFLSLVNSLGQSKTFMLYAIIDFLGIIFVMLKVPETKGTSLEQIEANLRNGVRSRDLGLPAKEGHI